MVCASLVELMECIYLKYREIMPGDLMKNQDTMQAVYHIEYPIETNLIRSIRSNNLQSQEIIHSLVATWKTWASPIYYQHRSTHICTTCGRELRRMNTHGCGSRNTFKKHILIERNSSKHQDLQSMAVPTM